ncbi:MAG: PQQ-binding-like beta-propeller repeat protein [Methanothrix sp.]|uniref:Pyrrolo-quinoline quinone n=1 Tax=Methanothrix harundinacea TaxID=301375 RepID=A0A101IIW7_9EURY|nr:MAG: Pyrrolo-quinoline quinone [Methanothrix harundinacea]KUK95685.1 MAG: Pyrrolo-quinoline quinone [Methanothrix harundinacea]MCP1392591.1 PQQ-like beta-propeller repeat protein [Methanothrix harundinacea]MDD5767994.1 PQQ-binding-like beta-propeller repeat protein [Methanothrix sp.]MDI9398838.1 PQQ-binding-like beta-propeller repeat protein [Euryarchaeota archaeon]
MTPTKLQILKTGAVLVLLVAMAQAVSDDGQSDQNSTEASGWYQFHQDLQNTGFSSSTAPRTNSTLWVSEDLGFQAGSSVAVADGKVFANGVDQIVAFDEFTGEVLWTAPFEKNADVCCSWFTPAYNEGKIYFSGMNTICLSSEDGSEIWNCSHPSKRGAVDGSPIVVDGKIIASDWDGHHYFCLDELTGEEIWSFEVEGDAQSTPAVSEGRVVVGAWEWGLGGAIHCIDLETGQAIWMMDAENSPAGSAAIMNGVVYMATYNFDGDGDLFALSLDDGSVLWSKVISPTDSTPTLVDGRVYVSGGCEGFSDSVSYCFNVADGDLLWSTDPKDEIGDWRCSMAYADGLVFSGKPDFEDFGGTVALDAITGDVVWSHPGGGSSPAISDGIVFSVGGGRVWAFGEIEAEDGAET